MSNAALFDDSAAPAFAEFDFGATVPQLYLGVQVFMTSAQYAAMISTSGRFVQAEDTASDRDAFRISQTGEFVSVLGDIVTAAGVFTPDVWHQVEFFWDVATATQAVKIDGVDYVDNVGIVSPEQVTLVLVGSAGAGGGAPGTGVYIGAVWAGTAIGLSDVLLEDWSAGNFSQWSFTIGTASVVTAPSAPPAFVPALGVVPPVEGRVLIALDDGPLEPDPTWTRIDDTDNFVSGYDIQTGKQTELDRTDTGTATVYLNDTAGLVDPMNTGSPYYGKIIGKQILLQLYDPTTTEWVEEWRGKIRDANYDVHPATNPDGTLVVATVQLECVDVFDYLAGYQLLPYPINGNAGASSGIVFYEDTAGTVDDRIIQVLTDLSVDSTRYVAFTGNVSLQEGKYDPGDSALSVLRDCADAEFPGLANIYVDRFGRFVFHGRRARFDPDGVIADGPVSSDTWDFHRWKVGDGLAIVGDSDYAQMRVLGFTHGESDVVNSAIGWPKVEAGVTVDMTAQSFEDATSIGQHGKCSLPPMSDLLIKAGTTTGNDKFVEAAKFAEFFVHYLKQPQPRITSLMVKAIGPADPRAASTWAVLTKADISDIMRTTVGYPGGVGLDMDNYIEGYTKRVRPLNPTHDYVEAEFNLTPTSWSMDPDMILAV